MNSARTKIATLLCSLFVIGISNVDHVIAITRQVKLIKEISSEKLPNSPLPRIIHLPDCSPGYLAPGLPPARYDCYRNIHPDWDWGLYYEKEFVPADPSTFKPPNLILARVTQPSPTDMIVEEKLIIYDIKSGDIFPLFGSLYCYIEKEIAIGIELNEFNEEFPLNEKSLFIPFTKEQSRFDYSVFIPHKIDEALCFYGNSIGDKPLPDCKFLRIECSGAKLLHTLEYRSRSCQYNIWDYDDMYTLKVGDILQTVKKGKSQGRRVVNIVAPQELKSREGFEFLPEDVKPRLVGWIELSAELIDLDENGRPIEKVDD